MSVWLDARVREVRRRLTSRDEGSLWLLFLDDPCGEVILAAALDGAMGSVDASMIRNLRQVIEGVPAPAVLLVVPRATARPLTAETALWRQLLASPPTNTELIDLLILGESDYWSVRREERGDGPPIRPTPTPHRQLPRSASSLHCQPRQP